MDETGYSNILQKCLVGFIIILISLIVIIIGMQIYKHADDKSSEPSNPEQPTEKVYGSISGDIKPVVKTIYHDSHKFILFIVGDQFQVENHPDCTKCNQKSGK